MKVQEFDHGSREAEVLAGMALDDSICGRISAQWDHPLFGSPSANIFGSLCVKYHRRHGKAPGTDSLRRLFAAWAEGRRDEESIRSGERYWAFLQDEIKRTDGSLNSGHVLDVAGALFEEVGQDNLVEKVKTERDNGSLEKAREAIANYRRVELGVGAGIDVHRDAAVLDAVFAARSDPLVVYPGALKHFFARVLERGKLIAFCGGEKAGKSWHLMDLAWRASEQGRKVAYFECGDMTEEDLMPRFYVRAASHPFDSSDREERWPCSVRFPSMLNPPVKPGNIVADPDWREMVFQQSLRKGRARKALETVVAGWGTEETRLRVSFHPPGTLGVDGMASLLDGWANEGWIADVVVCDYADILADPPGSHKDYRHAIGKNWEMLRALSVKYHALVVTATQATRDSYDKPSLLTRKSIPEDKRKNAYASAIVGINLVPEEVETDQRRLNWIVNRHRKWSWREVVHVAGCLALANPCVLSIFP